jgi:hypothetical protein
MAAFSTAFRVCLVAALPFVLLGASAPRVEAPDNAAIIYNPGNGDFTGFRIVVQRDGTAWATDGAGSSTGQLSPVLTQAFFTDLAAIPIAQQPVRACPSAQPGLDGMSIWLNAGLNRNANVQRSSTPDCAANPLLARLFDDAVAIQHALYVNAYRTRSLDNSATNATMASVPVAGTTPVYRVGSVSASVAGSTAAYQAPAGAYQPAAAYQAPAAGAYYANRFEVGTPYAAGGLSQTTFGSQPQGFSNSQAIGHFNGGGFHMDRFSAGSFSTGNSFHNQSFGSSGGLSSNGNTSFSRGGGVSQGSSLGNNSTFSSSSFGSSGAFNGGTTFGSGPCSCH